MFQKIVLDAARRPPSTGFGGRQVSSTWHDRPRKEEGFFGGAMCIGHFLTQKFRPDIKKKKKPGMIYTSPYRFCITF